MQLKYFKLLFIFTLTLNSTVACALTGKDVVKFEELDENIFLVSVQLSSGTDITGIKYKYHVLSKKWLLQIKHSSGISIKDKHSDKKDLTEEEFKELISILITNFADSGKSLDRIQLGLSLVDTLWDGTVAYLKESNIPLKYKLKAKDLGLTKTISTYLESTNTIQNLCRSIQVIKKSCNRKYLSMNPITFEPKYVDGEWKDIANLEDLGMPTDSLWYGINLTNN